MEVKLVCTPWLKWSIAAVFIVPTDNRGGELGYPQALVERGLWGFIDTQNHLHSLPFPVSVSRSSADCQPMGKGCMGWVMPWHL